MNINFFLLSIRPFLYYALFIILFMVFIIAILSNAPLQFIAFYMGLLLATSLRQLYIVTTTSPPTNPDPPLSYNSYLLTFNAYTLRHGKAFPLFVWAYTIAYLAYTTLMIKRITSPHIYFICFTLFYFICHLSYIFTIYNTIEYVKSIIFNTVFGFGLGLFIAYLIDRFINYKLLLFSTYKVQNTTIKCGTN